MGVVSPTLSTQLLRFAPVSDQGRITAASSLTASVAQAVGLAAAGALIAWQAPDLPGWLFASTMAACAAVGVRRLRGRAPRRVRPQPTCSSFALGRERDVGAVVRTLELDVVDRLVDAFARLGEALAERHDRQDATPCGDERAVVGRGRCPHGARRWWAPRTPPRSP